MSRRNMHPTHKILAAVLVLAACALGVPPGTAHAAQPDLSAYFPEDTLLYIGWTPWRSAADPQADADLRYVNALIAAVNQEESDALSQKLVNLAAALPSASGGIGLLDFRVRDDAPVIDAFALLSGDAGRQLLELLNSGFGDRAETRPQKVGPAELKSMPVGPGFLLLWGAHQEVTLVALGERAAQAAVERLAGGGAALSQAPEFTWQRKKLTVPADGPQFCIYADTRRMLERVRALLAEHPDAPAEMDKLLDELGLSAVRSKYLHVYTKDGRTQAAACVHIDGPYRGLLSIWDQAPLTDADLQLVPRDAYWAFVSNLDLAGLWRETLRVIQEVNPDIAAQVQGASAASTGVLGFSIPDEVLPALGDTWALYDAPDHGGLFGTGTVLIADVKNRDALHGALARVREMLGEAFAEHVKVQLHQTKYGEHTIHHVVIGGLPVPVAPAWTFVGDRWIFGLWPQTVAAAARQVDPRTRGATILDHPDVQAARAQLPKDAQGFGFVNMQYLSRWLYPLVKLAQTAGASLAAEPVNLALLPPLPEAVEGVHNSVGVTVRDQDGIVYASIGAGGTLPALVGGAAGAAAVLLPSLARSREMAKSAVVLSNLKQVGMACMMYAVDNDDRLPASLDPLLEAGFLSGKALESPFGVPVVYVGQGERIGRIKSPAQYVLAYETPHNDRHVAAVFADGHAENVPPAKFRELLRATYAEQGRTDQLPPEFRE